MDKYLFFEILYRKLINQLSEKNDIYKALFRNINWQIKYNFEYIYKLQVGVYLCKKVDYEDNFERFNYINNIQFIEDYIILNEKLFDKKIEISNKIISLESKIKYYSKFI